MFFKNLILKSFLKYPVAVFERQNECFFEKLFLKEPKKVLKIGTLTGLFR